MEKELEAELERLKKILKLGYELKVRWIPNNNSRISGEVRGDYIYLYDEDKEVALETLKHEFIGNPKCLFPTFTYQNSHLSR